MKRLILIVLTLVTIFGLQMPKVTAHELESSKGVSAIMHIEPDDNPKAFTPTTLNFSLSSTSGKFVVDDYSLSIKLVRDGVVKYRGRVTPAYPGATTEAAATVMFPGAAVYDVILQGAPAAEPNETAFTLDYIVRVSGTSASPQATAGKSTTALLVSVFSLIVLAMIATKNITRGGRYSAVSAKRK